MRVIQSDKGLIKLWTDFVPVDENSIQQLKNTANMPFIHHHIAAMPDVHFGLGATIGSVIPTVGAVIPAAVGVDIGCGMMAVRTSLEAHHLPDSLGQVRHSIERTVPVGFNCNKEVPEDAGQCLNIDNVLSDLEHILLLHPKIAKKGINKAGLQLGTLGGGNHFIEICLDEKDFVWVVLHSGSRGIGNQIGTYFIRQAKELMKRMHIELGDPNLSYLVEGDTIFNDYIFAMEAAQEYAAVNREVMMHRILQNLHFELPKFSIIGEAINCHHNYTTKEHHFGKNVWLTRKGAVNASVDQWGIIPGSMGAKSFIVQGKGCAESFNSCSHGAGRVMSRTQAKKELTLEQHAEDTKGVECRKDKEMLDESPRAYKSIDDVMKSQEDLVKIVHTLKQVVCVKG